MSIRWGLLAALAAVSALYVVYWARDCRGAGRPTPAETLVGFVTDFLDTLGIGSYATTTALFKLLALVPDENIPGTLNVGHAVPTFLEAFIFIAAVHIEGRTLALMILASALGAWFGAGVVTAWPRRRIQIGMGAALLVAAALFLMSNLGFFPLGGEALGLAGAKLGIGLGGNFVFGALMTLGIGAYAPA